MKNSNRRKLASTVQITVSSTVAQLPIRVHNILIRYQMGITKVLGDFLLLLVVGLAYGAAAYFDEADQKITDQQTIGAQSK